MFTILEDGRVVKRMKKVLVCCLLISLMISSLSTIAFAKQQPPITDYTDNTPNIYGDIVKTAESRIRINSFNYNINMSVPIFGQRNSAWASDLMKTANLTIGEAGCALSSSAMVAAYYGKSTNPQIFNVAMGNDACPLVWTQVANKGGSGYISGINTLISNPTLNQFFSYAQVAMEQNKPVLLGYIKPSGNTHYVVVKAVYGQGTSLSDYGCNDPWTGAYSNLYDTVGSQTLYKIVIYNR